GQLDEMKGLAMKVGQIVSYLDVPLPDPVQAQLARLQTGTGGMPPDETRAVVEGALGATVEELFERFDFEPVAAASIGQVHRARVGGRQVAVKVQYPEVAGSFAADLGALDGVAGLASLASAVDGRAIVRELAARLEEECDYTREAAMQRAFAARFHDDPRVVVPDVLVERSAEKVLTSAWLEGRAFADLPRDTSPEERGELAATLVRFSYRSLLGFGAIQADPHPGNFLFLEDGAVGFLDFGCVRELDAWMVEAQRELVTAVRHDDRPRFRAAVEALGMVGDARRFDFDHFFLVMAHLHRPFTVPRFHFTRGYVTEGYALNSATSPNARTLSLPPAAIWVMRLQWGLWSMLARLDAEGPFAAILDEVLDDAPLATTSRAEAQA
ncbi:MAG: AarF/ABC1/UbiB kinase family protein, partial [Myxococcales bacterium]|nr:AarF/ABC1/UbiB kinase family protein [Myxococcales bacterium]